MRAEDYTLHQAIDPRTPPETLIEINRLRPDLRHAVAINPSTPPVVIDWLAEVDDHAIRAALARRAAMPAGSPGQHSGTPHPGAQYPVTHHPGEPGRAPGWSQPGPHHQVPQQQMPAQPQFGAAQAWQQPGFPAPGQAAGAAQAAGAGAVPPGSAEPDAPPIPHAVRPVGGAVAYAGLPAGAPAAPPGRGSRAGAIAGIVLAVIVAVVVVIALYTFTTSRLNGSGSSGAAHTYGDDSYLDGLWDACEQGDGEACDDLYLESPVGSDYEHFGDTCGERIAPQTRWCVDVL